MALNRKYQIFLPGLLFLLIFTFVGSQTVLAANSDAQINTTLNSLQKSRIKHDLLEKHLEQVDRKIGNASKDIRNANLKLRQIRKDQKKLNRERNSINSNSGKAKNQLKSDIQQAYLMVKQHPLKLVMNQNQAGTIGRTLAYYQYYNQYRSQSLNRLGQRLNDLNRIDAELEVKKRALRQLLETIESRKSELKQARSKQIKAIDALNAYLEQQTHKLDRLTQSQTTITKTTNNKRTNSNEKSITGTAFAKLKGRLPLPVKGRVTKRFGNQRGIRHLKWQGLLIRAKQGSPVKAVADGEVVFSDWLRGYGFLTILDHGKGYMSLYGHNQSLLVTTGTKVQQNDTIATVGNSGGYRHSALYFEMRKKGKPFNPVRWLSRVN